MLRLLAAHGMACEGDTHQIQRRAPSGYTGWAAWGPEVVRQLQTDPVVAVDARFASLFTG